MYRGRSCIHSPELGSPFFDRGDPLAGSLSGLAGKERFGKPKRRLCDNNAMSGCSRKHDSSARPPLARVSYIIITIRVVLGCTDLSSWATGSLTNAPSSTCASLDAPAYLSDGRCFLHSRLTAPRYISMSDVHAYPVSPAKRSVKRPTRPAVLTRKSTVQYRGGDLTPRASPIGIDETIEGLETLDMAASFLQHCAFCEKQIMHPSNNMLYCSQALD
jgi:hypothetical protein